MATKKIAGGRATEAGMAFQAGVGGWFGANIVAEMPIGARFGLLHGVPTSLRFETGDAMDDIEVRLDSGGVILAQCKTRLSISARPKTEFAKVIAQLVAFRRGLGEADPSAATAVLAIAQGAPKSLDALNEACRAFDLGADWATVAKDLSKARLDVLHKFEAQVRASWHAPDGPSDRELEALARLFRIVRFDTALDPIGTDIRDGALVLGSRVYGDEASGILPMRDLVGVCRGMIGSGALANRMGLLQRLRTFGHADKRAPSHQADIDRLRDHTTNESQRLIRHRTLPIDGGVPLTRSVCREALSAAASSGNLLVIGEPGSGKTGLLLDIVAERTEATSPTVLISVDRHAGVGSLRALEDDLRLEKPLIEVLSNWPGDECGVLVIDALDASRGGPSEGAFATLIEEAVRRLGERWTILASIRTFDLMNGTRYRHLIPGAPPNPSFADPRLSPIRHFLIPELSPDDLADVTARSFRLGELIGRSPPQVLTLLRNVFNLSLAASLIEDGVAPQSIGSVATQSDLIDRYEDIRLAAIGATRAVKLTLEAMVERRAMSVREVEIQHDAVRAVVAQGVLSRTGDLVSFAHHILFDHAAGRYLLDWSDPQRLLAQVASDRGVGLILGPALRFAIERIWDPNDPERQAIWRLVERVVTSISSGSEPDPIATSVLLRSIAGHIQQPSDVDRLIALLRTAADSAPDRINALARIMSQLARYARLRLEEERPIAQQTSIAWAIVADAAAETANAGVISLLDGCRILLMVLSDRADLNDPLVATAFGRASRALLRAAWSFEPQAEKVAVNAIRFVGRSFGTDPIASRELLGRILEEPRFGAHAHEEAPYLAEFVRNIARSDPGFAVHIYEALFGRDAPSEGETSMGDSRILPLSSNRRQDYEHSRHYLREAIRGVLDDDATTGFRAVNVAVIGEKTRSQASEIVRVEVAGIAGSFTIIDDDILPQAWDPDGDPDGAVDDGGAVLRTFVAFLRQCPFETFRGIIRTALDEPTSATVWSRIVGVARNRSERFDRDLWPIVSTREFLETAATARDAIAYLGAVYSGVSEDQRFAFEKIAVADLSTNDHEAARWRSRLGRLVSVIPRDEFVSEEFRHLRDELIAAGEANGNDPFLTITSWGSEGSDIGDRMLERDGVDLAHPADVTVNELAKKLTDLIRHPSEGAPSVQEVVELWNATKETIEAMGGEGAAAHRETLHRALGAVSEAVERIASSDALTLDGVEMPSGEDLVALLEELSRCPYPAVARAGEHADEDLSLAWGNWDVRVYVASAIIPLISRVEGDLRERLMQVLNILLLDPVPSVRLQVAQRLNGLHGVDSETMWRLLEEVVRRETSTALLAFVVRLPLARLSRADPVRLDGVLATLLDRFPAQPRHDNGRSVLDEALGQLIAILAVNSERPTARDWINDWLSDLRTNGTRLRNVISTLRTDFFLGYRPSRSERAQVVFDRAKAILDRCVATAAAILLRIRPTLTTLDVADPGRRELRDEYVAADRLLDQCCDQLFFGAGAFAVSQGGEPIGLVDAEAKRQFLRDYATTLDYLGRVGAADTLHHLLDLLAFVAEANPPIVWDRIAAILVGGGAAEGYHFESLGADQVVDIVRRYLADHRFVFEDPMRRQGLISVLDLFARTGWPDALKLLYDLPDQLR